MVKFLIYFFLVIFTQVITYKIVSRIDKKQRERLLEWEKNYIEELKKNDLNNRDITTGNN